MTWLLLVMKKDDDGGWKPYGEPHSTREAAEIAGEALKAADPSVEFTVRPAN